jgi:hypothetical protein
MFERVGVKTGGGFKDGEEKWFERNYEWLREEEEV